MEYKINIPKSEVAVTLLSVAHSMAMAKTTREGTTSFHKPTYDNIYERICTTLVSQVELGKLKTCNYDGIEVTPDELTQDMQILNTYVVKPNWEEIKKQHPECEVEGTGCFNFSGVNLDLGESKPDLIQSKLNCYQSTIQQLNKWGDGTNVFIANEMPVDEVVSDLKDSEGNVIVAGYYRSYAGFSSEEEPENTETPTSKPLSRQQFQEDEILRVIRELGLIPTSIPQWESGKRGVKAQVRDELVGNAFPERVFEKAWERLRNSGEIKE